MTQVDRMPTPTDRRIAFRLVRGSETRDRSWVRARRRTVLRGLLAAAAACAGSLSVTVPEAGAVINGVVQNPMYTWAAKVYTPFGGCSGELIAPQWVATAAHCFKDESGSVIAAKTTVVLPAGTFYSNDVESTKWEVNLPSDKKDLEPDLAVIHLIYAPSGATPLPIATLQQENSFRKKGVTFFGFGHETYLTATLGKTQDGMWTLNANCPADLAEWNVDCFTHHSRTLGQVVHGDSGGAWVGWAGGQWVLLATETGESSLAYANVTQYGTSVVRWEWWIAKMEAKYATSPPPPPPPPPATPSISVSWGSNAAPSGNWMDITFTNFPTGSVSWVCVEEGQSYGPYSTTLTSSTETLTSHTCYDTEPGGTDYVTAGGVTSNTIGTD